MQLPLRFETRRDLRVHFSDYSWDCRRWFESVEPRLLIPNAWYHHPAVFGYLFPSTCLRLKVLKMKKKLKIPRWSKFTTLTRVNLFGFGASAVSPPPDLNLISLTRQKYSFLGCLRSLGFLVVQFIRIIVRLWSRWFRRLRTRVRVRLGGVKGLTRPRLLLQNRKVT